MTPPSPGRATFPFSTLSLDRRKGENAIVSLDWLWTHHTHVDDGSLAIVTAVREICDSMIMP